MNFFIILYIKSNNNNKHNNNIHNKNKLNNITKCPGRNSYRDPKGKCKCKPNYFGDPDQKSIGCWTCNPKCHQNAICKSQSHCICNGGYFGDGIISCKPISFLPVIESVHPSYGRSYSTNDYISIKMTTQIPENITAYAKFSDFVVNCNKSVYTLHCKLPWLIPSNTSLRVSYNGNDWSRNEWNFVFVETPKEITFNILIFFIALAIFLYIIIVSIPCNRKFSSHIQKMNNNADNVFPPSKSRLRKLSASSTTSTYDDDISFESSFD